MRIRIIFVLLMYYIAAYASASDKQSLQTKTNKNEISNEFNEITNRAEFDSEISSLRDNATINPGSGAMSEVFAPNIAAVADLQEIDAHSLEERGRDARCAQQNAYFNDFETDYSRPGAMAHKKDTEEIVDVYEKKMRDFTAVMQKAGVDCKEVPSANEIKDPYYIDIEKESHKEVEYDPKFCEFLRNTYNCNESSSIHCEQPNIKWGEWQRESIRVPGGELTSKAQGAFIFEKVASKIFEMKLRSATGSMKGYLSSKHKPLSMYHIIEISDNMSFDWQGGTYSMDGVCHAGRTLGSKDYAWNSYGITYFHREGTRICDKWSPEVWSESCGF